MSTLTVQTKSRAAALAFAATLAVTAATLPTSAWAVNGRTAVGNCIDSTASGARCGWAVSKDGSIDVCNKSGCVTCASAEAECTPAARKTPKHLTYGAGNAVKVVPGLKLKAAPQ
jgi:hypothetical protein